MLSFLVSSSAASATSAVFATAVGKTETRSHYSTHKESEIRFGMNSSITAIGFSAVAITA